MARRLSDLYIRGQELTIDDGQGEPVTVWMQRITQFEAEKAQKAANAASARMLSIRESPNSDDYQSIWSEVAEMDRDMRISFLAASDVARRSDAIEAQIAGEAPWRTDEENYLEGLLELWESNLQYVYAANPEDPEAKRVFDQMKKFRAEVDQAITDEMESFKNSWSMREDHELGEEVFKRSLDGASKSMWIREYRMQEVFYGTRDPEDHKKLYFESRDELYGLSMEVIRQLLAGYQSISVEPLVGKGSAGTPASSASSDQLETVEAQ